MKFGGVSPIPEERKSSVNKEVVHTQNMNAEISTNSDICAESTSKNSDNTDETTSMSSSIAAMQQAVHTFEEANIPQTTSLSTTIDPNEQDRDSNIIQHGQQDDIMSSPIRNASSIMYSEGTPSKLPDTDTPASLEISSSVKNSCFVGVVVENSFAHSSAEVSIDQYVEYETVSKSHIAASDDNVQETNNSDHITEQASHDEKILPECETVTTDKENEHPDKQDEDEKKPMKRRLGISGPAFSKKKLNVCLTNISDELHLKEYDDTIQICGTAKKDKILKYACQKCPEMFFTVEGYHKHLFQLHKIWNIKAHPPTVYVKTVTVLNPITKKKEETFETKFTKVNRAQQAKEMKVINASAESSSSPNRTIPQLSQPLIQWIDKWKSTIQKEIDIMPGIAEDSERSFKCSKCAKSFFFQVGLDTHVEHAHSNEKENRSNVNVQQEAPLPDIIAPKKS